MRGPSGPARSPPAPSSSALRLKAGKPVPCSSSPILTGFILQVEAAILFFPLLLSYICKSEAVLGKKKNTKL